MLTASRLQPSEIPRQVAELFSPPVQAPTEGPGRVGVELEWIPARSDLHPPGTVTVETLRGLLAKDPSLVGEARVTFEPGGQLEISPLPSPSVSHVINTLAAFKERLGRCLRPAGIELFSSGMNPWHSVDQLGLQTPGPRYVTQQAHYDAIGPAGRQMMRQTAALQINLDLGGPDVTDQRWRLANLAGPALSAAFANSPIVAGAPTGVPGTRSLTWQAVDPSRTGYDGAQLGPTARAAYERFVLDAEFMALPRNGEPPASLRASFQDWLDRGGSRPDFDDLTHHLTTLFPPVRPRHHLEVRYIDTPPERWLPVPIAILATLLYDRGATLEALRLLDGMPPDKSSWERSARRAMTDPGLRAVALALFDIAVSAIPRLPDGYLPMGAADLMSQYRDRFPAQHRCPADDQLDNYRTDPEDLHTWK
jgi:glutamate--cysteine ligase